MASFLLKNWYIFAYMRMSRIIAIRCHLTAPKRSIIPISHLCAAQLLWSPVSCLIPH